jgi:hypothetical protein
MQIGTATGTGTMATSSTIGSLSLYDGFWFGLDPWFYPYDDYYAYDDQDYYGYDASNDPYSVSMVGAVQSDLASKVTIAV